MYVCICILGYDIKRVSYCGIVKRKFENQNLGLNFLEASGKREPLYKFCWSFPAAMHTHTNFFAILYKKEK